jgi:hypothetical protein
MKYPNLHSRVARAAALPLLAALGSASVVACERVGPTDPPLLDLWANEVILEWNVVAHDALVAETEYANPLAAARIYAMTHLAQHDAINAITPAYETYALETRGPGAAPVAAAAAAAHGVLTVLLPAQRSLFDEQLARSIAGLPVGVRTAGVALGEQAAAAILERRQDDGADTPIVGDYVPGSGPGRYQFTPPFPFAFAPGWQHVQPFALSSADQFRSAPPPSLDSQAYATDFDEVRLIGRSDSPTRTPAQSASAKFWYEFSDIGWNRIARTVAAERTLGLQSTARLFALLNMALSDAYVAGWDGKYHYDFWRPYTAVREAGSDGNPLTTADPEWEPAEPTPPVQDYPSTHSALGNAAAAVLASVFGDDTPFTVTSSTAVPAGTSRAFASFSQAADENADSRVVGGLHFRFACEAGQELGRRVGDWTVAHHLRPR